MLRKIILKIKTKLALKKGDEHISEAYANAKKIGLLYSFDAERKSGVIEELITKFESDQKDVHTMTFVPAKSGETPEYAFFTEKDLGANGKWKNESVKEFSDQNFDFLVSLDWDVNKYTQHILATSRSKCRVGRYEEGKSQFFEFMITPKDDHYQGYLKELYHYLTNVRNG